ncbi:glycosyltransferase family 4 protein [Maribacter aestuarii]|uniref:glycosyltransferase family 4 protein n=1 Tax=Maribacter aestuarii TaxID=1130723 RepID=UPI00248CCFAF|nr:glycosyltransferase [Maribacter aestuarii]
MEFTYYYIYSNFDFTQTSAGATRMIYYAKALADINHKVFLVSCCSTKIDNECFKEMEPNIFVLEKKKLTKNFFKTIFFLKELSSFSNSHSGKKVYIYYPYPLVSLEILALIFFKYIKRKPVYYELNEIPKYTSSFHAPGSFRALKYSIKRIVFKTVFTVMEPFLIFYDGLICISTAMVNYGKRYNKNILRIPILTDPYKNIKKSSNLYAKENLTNIGFSGSIHPTKENLDSFINIITDLRKKGYKLSFNLCGTIFENYRNDFVEICRLRDEINYYGNLNPKEFSTFLSQQDILVIPRGFSLQNKYGFSTKLSDYLNHKKIILLTDISDNKLYIKDGFNGFIVPPDNELEMSNKLIYIYENLSVLNKHIIPNAIESSKNYFYFKNYKKELQNFVK